MSSVCLTGTKYTHKGNADKFDVKEGRYFVKLDNGKKMKFRAENLKADASAAKPDAKLAKPAEKAAAAGGGGGAGRTIQLRFHCVDVKIRT